MESFNLHNNNVQIRLQTTMSSIKSPRVSLIVAALLPELGIGFKGQLPWSLKQEMKYFRKLTTSTLDEKKKNAVIMGRKTYYSIPPKFRPLKGRLNVVLTRQYEKLTQEMKEELEANSNLKVSSSLPQTIEMLEQSGDSIEEIFIIGGAEVYNELMKEHSDLIDAIYLTEVKHGNQLEMDAFFKLDTKLWKKSPDQKLIDYLKTKQLDEEFVTCGNVENDFTYDFTLWEKL